MNNGNYDNRITICRMLNIPENSSYEVVRKQYKAQKKNGLYSEQTMETAWKEYCKRPENRCEMKRRAGKRLLIKILIGLAAFSFPVIMTYRDVDYNSEQMLASVCVGIYLFFAGWGIEVVLESDLDKVIDTPVIGLNIYLIVLVIGGAFGGFLVFVYRAFRKVQYAFGRRRDCR